VDEPSAGDHLQLRLECRSTVGGTLTVTPDLVDQELDLLDTQGVAYWEGGVSIQGQINGAPVEGLGYTEINPVGG
jgi:predicted secreted hydrolase